MTEKEIKLVIGGLLHDIGKVIYRADQQKHSESGYDFLVRELDITDLEILDSVRYHHAECLEQAEVDRDSVSYITCIANKIAADADRRQQENKDYDFEVSAPLQPVFNILNKNQEKRNQEKMFYQPQMLDGNINYPTSEKKMFDEAFYRKAQDKIAKVLKNLKDARLKNARWEDGWINALLNVLETTMCYVPSSLNKGEIADISLYDHVKLTAAISSCIYQYMEAKSIVDYRTFLREQEKQFLEEKAFLLYAIDISGIQNFIYTIQSKDALKMLRARSFYLEFLMEHIIDTLLQKLDLSRANLIYAGGGHCYMLLPNTVHVEQILQEHEKSINEWLREHFDVALYMASGYVAASARQLKNEPEGSYAELYRKISLRVGDKKAHRYSSEEILLLNRKKKVEYGRECSVCKTLGRLDEGKLCNICSRLNQLSKNILYQQFFVVVKEEEPHSLPLPEGYYLIAESKEKVLQRLKLPEKYAKIYSVNDAVIDEGEGLLSNATRLKIGNYTQGQTFEELAKAGPGIKRIGVLRADVDNLGQAFVSGFDRQYNTLSRMATFSRHLTLFFKYYINTLLEQGKFCLQKETAGPRNATIVYSGGDDVFIVGNWEAVIELSVDICRALKKYTEGTLSISGGIGVYGSKYPISRMAQEVGELEDMSKNYPGKCAVTIFPDGVHELKEGGTISNGTYSWDTFIKEVLRKKYKCLEEFFGQSEDRGSSFMYNLLELIRGRGERINFARYVYLLARMEPDKKADDSVKETYKRFSKKMYEWIQDEDACWQLRTAMNLYAYMVRKEDEI